MPSRLSTSFSSAAPRPFRSCARRQGAARAKSLDCPATGPLDVLCSDAAYAIGHELGHTFGPGHTCDDYPDHPRCADSIMQIGHPPCAILVQREIAVLLASPFFHSLSGMGGGEPAAPPIEVLFQDHK